MSCIKYLQDRSIYNLKKQGVITDNMEVTNFNALRRENEALSNKFKTFYDYNIVTPVGTLFKNQLVINSAANRIEDTIKEKANTLYKGVTNKPFSLGENTTILLTSEFISNTFMFVPRTVFPKVIEDGIIVDSKKNLRDILDTTKHEGFLQLINDIRSGENYKYLVAKFPSLVASVQENIIKARKEEADFLSKASKSSSKEVLEEIVKEEGNLELSSANSFLNDIIENTKTEYTVTSIRESEANFQGSANVTGLNIGIFNIALTSRSKERQQTTIAKTYVHEKAHIVTISLLQYDPNFRAKITELFNEAKKGLRIKEHYGIKDIYEFLAEGLSNKEFQDALEGINYKDKSIFEELKDFIINTFSKILGRNVRTNSILNELLTSTESTSNKIIDAKLKLHNIEFDIHKVFEFITKDGKYKGPASKDQIYSWARKHGFSYNGIENQFYLNNTMKTKVGKSELVASMDFKRNSFFYEDMLESGHITSIEDYLDNKKIEITIGNPFVKYNVDLNNINGDIRNLISANSLKIKAPNKTEKGAYYEVNGFEQFRVGNFLGFSMDAQDREKQIIKNAIAVGNVADELSKRVFGELYDHKDISYEKINEFVKEEAYEMVSKLYTDKEDWSSKYKNPLSREAYDKLLTALEDVKSDLLSNHNVRTFHSDIIVWDTDTVNSPNRRIAGEIDILAELNDGSFTVIDMKTRRAGEEGYAVPYEGSFSTKKKHTLQTSVYSELLEKMGFKVNDPKIIMAKPLYDNNTPVDNQDIGTLNDGSYAVLIPLNRTLDYFNYSQRDPGLNQSELNDSLKKNQEAKRRDYYKFINDIKEINSLMDSDTYIKDKEERATEIRLELKKLLDTLTTYDKMLKKNGTSKISKELKEVSNRLKEELLKEEDKQSFRVQVDITYDFLKYAEEELKFLITRLNDMDTVNTATVADEKAAYVEIGKYKGIYETAQKLYSTLDEYKNDLDITSFEFERLTDVYNKFQTLNGKVNSQLRIKNKSLFISILVDGQYYGSKAEIKMKNALRKRGEELFPGDKGKIQEYVNKQSSTREFKKEIMSEYAKEVKDLTKGVQYDMLAASYYVNSDVMVSNHYVQLIHNMLSSAEQEFTSIANEEMVALYKAYKDLNLSNKEIRTLIRKDSEGDSYLLSKYKIEYFDKVNSFKKRLAELNERDFSTSAEKANIATEIRKVKAERSKWMEVNSKEKGGRDDVPIDKWLDKTVLSDNLKKALKIFKKIQAKNELRIKGRGNSLIARNYLNSVVYFRLPGIKETPFGNIIKGDFLKGLKKVWDDTTKVEIGDTEEGFSVNKDGEVVKLEYTGLDGKPILSNPLFYRGKPKETQSTDLFSIYALELQNGIRYEIDSRVSVDATIIMDLIDNTQFYKTIAGFKVVNALTKGSDSLSDIIMGDASIVSKMVRKMFKNRVYSMSQEYVGNIAGMDVNRVMQFISTYTAFSSMSFKYLSASNNWVTGQVSEIIEAAGGEFFNFGDLQIAKNKYAAEIMHIAADAGNPVKTSFVNQLMTLLEIQSEPDILNNRFERKNKLTRFAEPGTSLAGYSLGEHEIHATLGMAILQGMKVLNAKGEFLDKNGKVTSKRSNAASVLDSFSLVNGVIKQAEWAKYNEHDTINHSKGGGLTSLRTLIKDRVVRTQGAFGTKTKSQIDRLWYGKLFKQFKKHIPPQTLNRYRGISDALKKTSDIEEHRKYYNFNAKTEEYGYFVSFIRFINNIIKQERFNILNWSKAGKNEWKEMHKHERANVVKTTTELAFLAFVFVLAGMAAGAAEDDDDNELLWHSSYLLRKQFGDSGGQYFSPSEMWRIADSPFAAIKSLNNTFSTLTQLVNPNEEYTSGVHAKENKLWRKVKRTSIILDVADQFNKGKAKEKYTGITNQ